MKYKVLLFFCIINSSLVISQDVKRNIIENLELYYGQKSSELPTASIRTSPSEYKLRIKNDIGYEEYYFNLKDGVSNFIICKVMGNQALIENKLNLLFNYMDKFPAPILDSTDGYAWLIGSERLIGITKVFQEEGMFGFFVFIGKAE